MTGVSFLVDNVTHTNDEDIAEILNKQFYSVFFLKTMENT